MNSREQIAKKRVQSAEDELKRAKAALNVLMDDEVTYSVADRFKRKSGSKWMLVCGSGIVSMISLKGGMVYKTGVRVANKQSITPKEFIEIVDDSNQYFTRYWDNAKEEYTDGRK